MYDDAKATVEERPEDANQTDTPKVEEPKEEVFQFRLKVQGEIQDVSLTREEVVKQLQLAADYMKKTEKLAADRRRIEPYLSILASEEFEAFLQQLQGEQPEQKEKELFTRMKRGDVGAAAMLILQRSRGIQT